MNKPISDIKQFAGLENQTVVYIAGKVTGLPYSEVENKFNSRAKKLRKMGFFVLNPIDIVHPECNWEQAMRICLSFLPYADYIDMLPCGRNSKGALLEFQLAKKMGIRVFKNSIKEDILNKIAHETI